MYIDPPIDDKELKAIFDDLCQAWEALASVAMQVPGAQEVIGPRATMPHVVSMVFDQASQAVASRSGPERDALTRCRKWIEKDEGRSLESIVDIDMISRMRSGRPGFNEEFVAMCKALIAATSSATEEGSR